MKVMELTKSCCGVVDKSLTLYPGFLSLIPGSPSLPDESLSCGPVFWDALKPEPLPVEPLGAPSHKLTQGKFDEFISPDEGLFERNM